VLILYEIFKSQPWRGSDRTKVSEKKSFIWPHYDIALLGLQKNINNDATKHIESISNSPICLFSQSSDGSAYERGSVYAIAALSEFNIENPSYFWIEGGSIIFPNKIRRSFQDINYKRVLKYTISEEVMDQVYDISIGGSSIETEKLEKLKSSIQHANKKIKEAFSGQGTGLFRYFMADLGDSNLPDLAKIERYQINPTWDGKKIYAFGTDLDTKPGVSGSPIFKILDKKKDQLIGIHSGVASSTGLAMDSISLNNYSREIPLQHAIDEIDKKIEQLNN